MKLFSLFFVFILCVAFSFKSKGSEVNKIIEEVNKLSVTEQIKLATKFYETYVKFFVLGVLNDENELVENVKKLRIWRKKNALAFECFIRHSDVVEKKSMSSFRHFQYLYATTSVKHVANPNILHLETEAIGSISMYCYNIDFSDRELMNETEVNNLINGKRKKIEDFFRKHYPNINVNDEIPGFNHKNKLKIYVEKEDLKFTSLVGEIVLNPDVREIVSEFCKCMDCYPIYKIPYEKDACFVINHHTGKLFKIYVERLAK